MVSLIGAGPGDPDLLTIKALRRLETADIVFYDRLANTELLQYCKDNAEIIFVGKAAAHHYVKQNDIINMLINSAKSGKNVVRLKGGDPLIFGRGSEEAIALRHADIEFEFVPGISAGIAATAYAGIPLTHRNLVTKCIFITAHEDPKKIETQNDWYEIAQLKNSTIVIYMGVGNAPQISSILIREGMDKYIPVAIIENGTHTYQRTFVTDLENIEKTINENKVQPPALFVISPTVDLKSELDWFETKPLFGVRIAATRAAAQINSLCTELRELGADIIPFSVIETHLSKPKQSMRKILSAKKYDWLLFTSENGVRYFFELLARENLDARAIANMKIAAIGKGTAHRLKEYKINADFVPSEYTSEAMLREFPKDKDIASLNFLRVKGNFLNDYLVDGLEKLNANVDTVEVYKINKSKPDEQTISRIIEDGIDAITFTSQSTVNNFLTLFGMEEAKHIFERAIPFAIGPVTAQALEQHGIKNYRIAKIHTVAGIIEEIREYFTEKNN